MASFRYIFNQQQELVHSNISDLSQPHQNQNNALNHSQYINLLNVHRNTEKACLKQKKVRTPRLKKTILTRPFNVLSMMIIFI